LTSRQASATRRRRRIRLLEKGADDRVGALYAKLCDRVPDAAKRAELLAVAPELEAAWQQGDRLPLLRAHRKALERAIRTAE
jgi:hypothetical protein